MNPQTNRAWRVAIVGTGGIAGSHVSGWHDQNRNSEVPQVEIVAAQDIDQSRVDAFTQKHEIPAAYTDLTTLLEKEKPDFVSICTPPGTHADLIVQSLEGGASVLCEKPLCAGLAEVDRVQEAEKRTGQHCAGVFQWRFGSAGRHLAQLIQQQAMGRPLVGVCNTLWYRDAAYYAVPWRGKWDTELGGPTMGHGIHAIDFFLSLLGDWSEVCAMIGTLDRDIEVEDVSMALVKFQNGAMGSIVNSVLSPRQESYVRLDFQQATVELSHLYSYTNADWRWSTYDNSELKAELERWQQIPEDVSSSHGAQITAILEHAARGERPPVNTDDARMTLEFLTAIYKASVTGQAVAQGSIVSGDPFYEHVGGTLAQK